VLLTNDRPVLPATAAFKGRLRFVPFLADFTGCEDLALENTLEAEMPGILWRLIKIAPAVFADGDVPPATVRDATEDLLDENDVSRPFIEECLVEDPAAVTPLSEMEAAIQRWLGTLVVGGQDVKRIMQGVRSRWPYKRKRVPGRNQGIHGLIGVRVTSS
jgi:phage/plasmid-associated DNA primase